ncbi:S8 family serine peptidase [Conexibacter stalactiti]|uniref:S8 family serine peptidase n=1 Tax=Conexibacter stalactiti TaxID=1940611 RepID=A0ABU4HJM5_9ACTN|nr:S8 family serine peptidase [Conexibacter stalactiti]MDW5593518.1 S8 family serine peptidase [Conexibacter stalactiti]MEC5034159.1 S8 family serine peptidase [Conexibacter stalactiti]
MRNRPLLPALGSRRLAVALAAACAAVAAAPSGAAASNGGAPAYAPGEVVVGYEPAVDARAQAATARAVGAAAGSDAGSTRTRVLRVPAGQVRATVAKLRRQPGVKYAAPNPIARASVVPLPDDTGIKGFPGGLAALQWNFFGDRGVGALEAWTNADAAGAPGGRGVRIAVLDTGVAYRDFGRFKASPDFAGTKFVAPYDFVDGRREAVDRNGHGTHVAGTIAEATNNRLGVTGLAYGATVMPVRVLDSQGYGDAATIAKGIRYAARHNAKVINMSLEFSTSVRASEIPDIMAAIRYATERGSIVIGSTGNEGEAQVAYPARASLVVSVGATTDQGCLASFSNDGVGLDIVAPGGGENASLTQDPNCQAGHRGRDIYQMTYAGSVSRFGLPAGYDGTSMAAPHVSATAALIIATKVIGTNPTPAQVECRIKATARALGIPGPNRIYGWGLVDAGAATSPAVPTPSCLARTSTRAPR